MHLIATELENLIRQHMDELLAIPEDELRFKSSPARWSKKEIIGHMVDSAQNNLRRFIVAQYEETPSIVYNQDKWVALSGYQEYDSEDLVRLWYLLNKHIAAILKNADPEMALRSCQTEKVHTLEWLATDYVKHLRHHLHQVLELEPVAYP